MLIKVSRKCGCCYNRPVLFISRPACNPTNRTLVSDSASDTSPVCEAHRKQMNKSGRITRRVLLCNLLPSYSFICLGIEMTNRRAGEEQKTTTKVSCRWWRTTWPSFWSKGATSFEEEREKQALRQRCRQETHRTLSLFFSWSHARVTLEASRDFLRLLARKACMMQSSFQRRRRSSVHLSGWREHILMFFSVSFFLRE